MAPYNPLVSVRAMAENPSWPAERQSAASDDTPRIGEYSE
jgi:hypothetical protein